MSALMLVNYPPSNLREFFFGRAAQVLFWPPFRGAIAVWMRIDFFGKFCGGEQSDSEAGAGTSMADASPCAEPHREVGS